MTTLELISKSPPYRPYTFKSLGVFNSSTAHFDESTDFPKGTEYVLTAGKFPLTDGVNDYFFKSGLYHTLNKDIEVELTGSHAYCDEGKLNKEFCRIIVKKKATTGGRKNKSNRRKSNRRKSNRRKSNRRR
jgi:hypothetical protein